MDNYKILGDGALENVNGGAGAKARSRSGSDNTTVSAHCPTCKKITTFTPISGARGKCHECGNVTEI